MSGPWYIVVLTPGAAVFTCLSMSGGTVLVDWSRCVSRWVASLPDGYLVSATGRVVITEEVGERAAVAAVALRRPNADTHTLITLRSLIDHSAGVDVERIISTGDRQPTLQELSDAAEQEARARSAAGIVDTVVKAGIGMLVVVIVAAVSWIALTRSGGSKSWV